MKEIWSVIVGFPMYKISTFGRVKSLYTNKILKPINKKGYMFVTLAEGGKQYNRAIHRLVAKYFIPNPNNKKYVNHKHCIRSDNRVGNLEWVTAKENTDYTLKVNHIIRSSGNGRYISNFNYNCKSNQVK